MYKNNHEQVTISISKFFKWIFGGVGKDQSVFSLEQLKKSEAKVVSPDMEKIHHPPADQIQITWIGHATFLIQYDGLAILTDPVFSQRISPLPFGGMKRILPPGLRIDQLPKIDFVLLSHNHYDHLDLPSLRKLKGSPKIICPNGNRKLLQRVFSGESIYEANWGGKIEFPDIVFEAFPAQHWSGRFLIDANKSLWASWMIRGNNKTIYFAGDTGYCEDFKKIPLQAPVIDCALIPIGAYNPRNVMRIQHVNPAEAFEIHKEIGSRFSIGMHWATFPLSAEPVGEPALWLEQLSKDSPGTKPFVVLNIGQTILID